MVAHSFRLGAAYHIRHQSKMTLTLSGIHSKDVSGLASPPREKPKLCEGKHMFHFGKVDQWKMLNIKWISQLKITITHFLGPSIFRQAS